MSNKTIPGAFDSMKHRFPVTKTIAFRLIPEGKTLENMKKDNVISDSEKNHGHYLLMKEVADNVHKNFIEKTLRPFRLKCDSDGAKDSIQEYAEIFFDRHLKSYEKEDRLKKIAKKLKAQVGDAFRSVPFDKDTTMLKALASSKLITDIIPTMGGELNDEQKKAYTAISTFTSYMQPYYEARNRIYDDSQGGHTIPVRIVDDNLPIHLGNINVARDVPEEVIDRFRSNTFFADYLRKTVQVDDITDVFTVAFGATLCAQSAIDAYNTLIGGVSVDNNTHHQGLNELINEYNQKHPKSKVKKFKQLKKQILSDRKSISHVPKALGDDMQVLDLVKQIKDRLIDTFGDTNLTDLCFNPDKRKTFIDMKRLSDYSHKAFGGWNAAKNALKKKIASETPRTKRISNEGYEKKIENIFKKIEYVSIADIEEAAVLDNQNPKASMQEILRQGILKNILSALSEYKKLDAVTHLDSHPVLKQKLGQSAVDGKQNAGAIVKLFLDTVNDAVRVTKMFTKGEGDLDFDRPFYEEVVFPIIDFADEFVPAYNSIRNYLTKKPYSIAKLGLDFNSATLLKGWDMSKIMGNRGIIFREGDTLYLGVLKAKERNDDGKRTRTKNILKKETDYLDEGSGFHMFVGKALKSANMTLPKVAFAPGNISVYNPPKAVLDLRESKKPVADYTPEEVTMMIDFYKGVIAANHEWDIIGFQFKETGEYKQLNDFFDDFDQQSYAMRYVGVSKNYFMKAVEDGNLYLFRITCQDMLEKHHGKDGDYKVLLTEALSGKKGSVVRLRGGAAIYYRKASLAKKVTHPAGVPMANKNPDNPNPTRTLPYDLYKDKRYMEDRFAFHVPVTVYPLADSKGDKKVTDEIRDIIRETPGMYVLGINRGERNLISIAVTAPDGRIVEQRNLNVFDNYDYRRALATRGKQRNDDRQNWNAVHDIKNLKKGYLSRAVGEIVRLVKKYNCVVAMENLDLEFKNSRQAFEANVYRQFERDLVKKFSLLTCKDSADRFADALQLCNPGSTEEERTRYPQNGIVFFMNPSWVTKTDPLTGFVNRLNTRFTTIADAEAFMGNMDAFHFDPAKGRFVLSFHYGKAAPEKEAGDPDRVWDVETYGERIENVFSTDTNPKGEWEDKTVDLTADMKALMSNNGIAFEDGQDLIPQMKGHGTAFWTEFYRLLRLTLQNTSWNSESREWRVVGCTAKDGRFYDSRQALEHQPMDADINAAWNIARKAHLALRHIRDFVPGMTLDQEGKKAKGPSAIVTDAEWFGNVQN